MYTDIPDYVTNSLAFTIANRETHPNPNIVKSGQAIKEFVRKVFDEKNYNTIYVLAETMKKFSDSKFLAYILAHTGEMDNTQIWCEHHLTKDEFSELDSYIAVTK